MNIPQIIVCLEAVFADFVKKISRFATEKDFENQK